MTRTEGQRRPVYAISAAAIGVRAQDDGLFEVMRRRPAVRRRHADNPAIRERGDPVLASRTPP